MIEFIIPDLEPEITVEPYDIYNNVRYFTGRCKSFDMRSWILLKNIACNNGFTVEMKDSLLKNKLSKSAINDICPKLRDVKSIY